MKTISAVLFDWDGLSVNTVPFVQQAYANVLRDCGVCVDFSGRLVELMGMVDTMSFLKEEFQLLDPIEDLEAAFDRTYLELITQNGVEAMPDLMPLLDMLDEKGAVKIVASGSTDQYLSIGMQQLELSNRFDAVISSNGCRHKVDIYRKALRMTGLEAEACCCIALEDSKAGVCAAKEAGIIAVAVPNIYTKTHCFSDASRVVETGLAGVTWELLESLVKEKALCQHH
jgi:HAD superfamily hydrolase (TIGR01509 family)